MFLPLCVRVWMSPHIYMSVTYQYKKTHSIWVVLSYIRWCMRVILYGEYDDNFAVRVLSIGVCSQSYSQAQHPVLSFTPILIILWHWNCFVSMRYMLERITQLIYRHGWYIMATSIESFSFTTSNVIWCMVQGICVAMTENGYGRSEALILLRTI